MAQPVEFFNGLLAVGARNASKLTMDNEPWFKNGLRFECTQCGNCCTGAPGYVWVNRDEIAALARQIGVTVAEFEQKYVRTVGIRKSLIEFSNGDCVFFDSHARKCTVYEARPRQCRTWPFWQSNVASKEAWERTCEICPGSGKGTLYPAQRILHQISVVKI